VSLYSLNHQWRILAAGFSYIIFGIGAFLPGLYILCLAVIPMNANTKQKRVRQSIKFLCRFYVDFLQFIGLMSYRIEKYSTDKLESHLVIANHSMLIDALFALAYIDNLCCIVKSELCKNIITRLPIRLAGYIPNDSEMLVQLAKERLENGENVLIFPEGTRNQHDLQLDFKRGAANIALISDSSILPIVICCTPRALEKGQKWYELPDRKFHVSIRINQPLEIKNCVDRKLSRSMQYRRLTEWLRNYYTEQVSQIIS
jgi:1-acyl-sn-glycerol-3-phosphate acyltransferase